MGNLPLIFLSTLSLCFTLGLMKRASLMEQERVKVDLKKRP